MARRMICASRRGCAMSDLCLHCETALESNWEFCAKCGTHIERHAEPVRPAEPPPPAEAAPVQGAFSGLYFGLIAMPLMLVVGVMLCLTGWGIFLGIPVIIGAMLAPLAGPLLGLGAAKDKVL